MAAPVNHRDLTLGAAAAALLALAASPAYAEAQQQRFTIGGWKDPPRHHGGGHHHNPGHHAFPVFFIESAPPVIIEREVVREVPVGELGTPNTEDLGTPNRDVPREPYVIGKIYASLTGPCMKMIEDGASFYLCGGDWYRQVGKQYKAVARP